MEPYPALSQAVLRSATPSVREPTRQLSATPLAHSRQRERSASSMQPPPVPNQQPLFRAETPASESGEDEDMSNFRFRSQSLAMTEEDHQEMQNNQFLTTPQPITSTVADEEQEEDPFDLDIPDELPVESMISRVGNSRDVESGPRNLDLKQYMYKK